MGWLNRLSNLFRRDRMDRELKEELEFHLEARERDNLRAGMTEVAARYDARRRFGNATAAKERAHEVNIVAWMETLRRDLVYALRGLKNSPGFTLVADSDAGAGVWREYRGIHGGEWSAVQASSVSRSGAAAFDLVCSRKIVCDAQGLFDRDYLEFQRQTRRRLNRLRLSTKILPL